MRWLRYFFCRHDWVAPGIMNAYPFCRRCGKPW